MNPHLLTIGIDEAGRGCVIGPLVLACVAASDQDRKQFSRWHVRDSKIVPEDERTWLAQKIMARCWHRFHVILPPDIDLAVRDRSRTLNGLEREHMSALLREARQALPNVRLHAIIDCPSINQVRFGQQLSEETAWQEPDTLLATHRADARFMAVAAASIIAKHVREQEICALKSMLDTDFGCGYPHDPLTQAHLRTCGREAPHVRWTWSTAARYNQHG